MEMTAYLPVQCVSLFKRRGQSHWKTLCLLYCQSAIIESSSLSSLHYETILPKSPRRHTERLKHAAPGNVCASVFACVCV